MTPNRIETDKLKPEERILLASLLFKCDYQVTPGSYRVPRGKTSKTIYYVEFDRPKEG